jgi:NADH-quinone oxidoreductase subunit G
MAAAAQPQMVTITINSIEIQVPKGEMIVESAKRLGLDIPVFCYHSRLKPVGMCRMCLVEVGTQGPDGSVRMMPKPQTACSLPASDGLVIITDSEQLQRDRRGVLEFLLVNHPLDCPICDRGGECPLQNNTLAYGPSTSRFTEVKRHLPKAYPLSRYVTLDLERCIQCGRCVRFTQEISGDSQLAMHFRGASMQPGTFQLTDFESRFSGNVIEICPVGALTSSQYRFRARPWDLQAAPGLCSLTPCGTNIWFDHRSGRLARINGRTNEAVNEEWTCDLTKFGHDDLYSAPDRLRSPFLRRGDGMAACSWSEAYSALVPALQAGEAGVIASPMLSNESLYALQELFRKGLGSGHIDHGSGSAPAGFDPVPLTIMGLESLSSAFVFGMSLAAEQPMSFLRLRKAWLNKGLQLHTCHHEPAETDLFAASFLRYEQGDEAAQAARLLAAVRGEDNAFSASAKALRENGALLAPRRLLRTSPEAAESLRQAAEAAGAAYWLMAGASNEQGALDLGATPDGLGTEGMLRAAAEGRIKALFLAGFDPLGDPDLRELAEAALESVEFLAVLESRQTEACSYASVILPMALPAEQDGTYTSVERRVQRMAAILTPPGESKAPWRVFTEIMIRLQPGTPAFNPREIRERIAAEVPIFRGLTEEQLEGEGFLARPAVAAGAAS